MISHTRQLVLSFGLVASFWCTADAPAQERPALQQPQQGGRSAAAATTRGVWDTVEWVERRYKIEALRFKCRDETGYDWPGSDEVMVSTSDSKGWTVSDEIGDIDSGDTHSFDPARSCIVAVRPGTVVLGKSSVCDEVGEAAPLSFGVEFWEKDWSLTGFCTVVASPGSGLHDGPHCGHDGGDDFIGGARLNFAPGELEAALPNVGDELIETVPLQNCFGNSASVCDAGWGPYDVGDYSFTYRVTRLRDVRVGMRGLLDQTMKRTGIRPEIEAIAAGLRALRAPTPRHTEPKAISK